jgi:mycothiol S-conjugate amidase
VEVAAEALVRLVREFRPHVITTYDENGGYPHPDHIMTHTISMAAFDAAGDPDAFPEAGEPWQPLKLYYNQGISLARIKALDAAMTARGLESPYKEWIARWDESERKPREITTRVPCGEYFELRDRALLAHATQIDPDGPWFRIPLEIQREVWPTEDYELARSLVDTSLPEDDLFAGITADIVSA